MSQVVGRRLDVPDGTSLVLFRETPSAVNDPPSSPNKGAIEASRLKQDQIKKNIDKLKWHATKPKLHLVPMAVKQPTTARLQTVANKNIPMSTDKANENKNPVDPILKIEARTKRAAEWLNNEKKEIHSKIQEKVNYRESAKELDLRRRQILMEDARRKKKAQLELLHLDAPEPEVKSPDHGTDVDQDYENDEREAIALVRMSNESVIDKLAENMVLPKAHLPIVPRLSKNYVNRSSLVLKESSEPPSSPVHLVRNRPEKSAGQCGDDEEEEDYGEDDFEGPDNGGATSSGAPSTAGAPVRRSTKTAKTTPEEDLITLRAKEEAERRREEGKQFLRLQKLKALAKEREEREAERREAEKKREMLEKLQSTILEKNAEEMQKQRAAQAAAAAANKNKADNTRVFQYTLDGGDFHRNYRGGVDDEVGDVEEGEEVLDLRNRHLDDEDDVPLQDFLRPKQGERPQTTPGGGGASVGSKNKTGTPSTGAGGGSVGRRSDTHSRSRSVDSASRGRRSGGTPEDKSTGVKTTAPFHFYGWKTNKVNAVAKAKEYYNTVVVPNVVINHAVTRSTEEVGGGSASDSERYLKGRPGGSSAHPQPRLDTRLASSSEGRQPRRKSAGSGGGGRKHRVRNSHDRPSAASLDHHFGSQERLSRGRSLIDDAFNNDVLELLGRSDLPPSAHPLGSHDTAFQDYPAVSAPRHNPLADLHKLTTQPPLNLPIQQSLDVSAMATRNLTEVKKAIDNVDRLCQLLNSRTQELEKLSVRDSMESVDLSAMRAAVAAKLAAKTKNLLESAGPLMEEEEDDDDSGEESSEGSSSEASTSDEERDTEVEVSKKSVQVPAAAAARYEEDQEDESRDSEEDEEENGMNEGDFYANRLMLSHSKNEDSVRQSYDHLPSKTSSSAKFKSADIKDNKEHLHVQYDRTTIEDPVLRHQLGLLADKNHIIAKYSKLDLSNDESVDFKRRQEEYDMLYTAVDQQRRDTAKNFGTMPKPVSKFRNPDQQADLPSLRNVGELAGLLRTNYLKEETQESLDIVESDESDDDKDLRAVNIVAKALVHKKQAAVAEKHLEKESVSSPARVDHQTVKSSIDSSAPLTEETAEVPDSPLSFWDSMLTRPLVHSSNAGGLSISTEKLLSELRSQDPARYGQNYQFEVENKDEDDSVNMAASPVPMQQPVSPTSSGSASAGGAASSSAGITTSESGASPKVAGAGPAKLSPAELKELFQQEMRKQDDYINLTVELAEIEKANAIQTARELQHAAQVRSEQELAQLKMQQELELQKYAYENALAISMANAHLVAEQNNMAQKEELMNLHTQMSLQQVQSEYNALLSHAGSVAENLEHTKRMLEMEAALKAEQEKAAELERERLMNEERDRLLAAQKEMALEHERKLLQEREQMIAMAHRQRQIEIAHSKKASKAALAGSLSSSHASVLSSADSLPLKQPATSAVDESHQDYTVDFEQESRDIVTKNKHDDSIASSIEYSRQFSRRSEDDGEVSDEDFVVTKESDDESDEISEEAESSLPSGKRPPVVPVVTKKPVAKTEDSISEVEESYYSMSKEEVSDSIIEVSAPATATGKQQYSTYQPEESSESEAEEVSDDEDEAEVSEDIVESAEDADNYSNGFDEYSDTFESKMSIASSMSNIQPPPPVKKTAVGTGRSTKEDLKLMKASLLEASRSSSSGEKDSVELDDAELNRVLDQYKAEMEGRLRAQEQTHKLRVNFLKAKHAQRVAALEALSKDSSFTPEQIDAERQRVQDLFGEERAVLEKERWTMNANAYKEMRKFNTLKKELTSYKANLANNSAIQQEMRDSILNVLQKGKQSEEDFEMESFEDSQYPPAAGTTKAPAKKATQMNVATEVVAHRHDDSVSYGESFVEESVVQNKSLRQSTSYLQTFDEIPSEAEEDEEYESTVKSMLSKTAQSILSGQAAGLDEEDEVSEEIEESRPEEASIDTADSSFDEEAERTEQSRTHEDFEVTEEYSDFKTEGEDDDGDFEYDESEPAVQTHLTSGGIAESGAYMEDDFEAEESHLKSVQFAANLEMPSPENVKAAVAAAAKVDESNEDFEIEEEIDEESHDYSESADQSHSQAQSTEYQSAEFEEVSASAKQTESTAALSREDSYAQDFDEDEADDSQEVSKSVRFEDKVVDAEPSAPTVVVSSAKATESSEDEEESEIEEEIEQSYEQTEDEEETEQSRKSEASQQRSPEKPSTFPQQDVVNQSSSFEASSRYSADDAEEEFVAESQASDSPQQKSRTEDRETLKEAEEEEESEPEPDADVEQERLEESYSDEDFASEEEDQSSPSPAPAVTSPPKPEVKPASFVRKEEESDEEIIEEVEEDLDEVEEDEQEATNSFAESSRVSQSAKPLEVTEKSPASSPAATPGKVISVAAEEDDEVEASYEEEQFDEYDANASALPSTSEPANNVPDHQVSEMTDSRDISDEISEDFDDLVERENLQIDIVPKPPSSPTVSASGVPKSPFLNTRSRSDSKDIDKWSARSMSSTSSEAEFELVLTGRKSLAFTGGLDLTAGIASVTHDSASNMRFDKETQRWVGGDEVSLEGFEDSVDGLSPRRKRLSTSSTMSDAAEKAMELEKMETSSSGNNSAKDPRTEGIAGGQVGGTPVGQLETEKSAASIDDREVVDETPLGADDSFLSVVSEEENNMFSPFPILETVAENHSDSDNTVGWGNKTDSATAVIVTSNVLPVIKTDSADAEEENEIEEKFSDSEDDLEALLDEIDSPIKNKKQQQVTPAAKLEISADLTVSGNLDDMSLDFIEENVVRPPPPAAAAVVAPSAVKPAVGVPKDVVPTADQQLALKEKQADEITDVLMDRIVQNSLNTILKGMDFSNFLKSNITSAVNTATAESVNVSVNESASSDSFDAFAEQKANQFQQKHQQSDKPHSPHSPGSPPSLSSVKGMPSLLGNKKTSPRSHQLHGLGSSSSSGDENDTEVYNFDDALSSALGIEDKSPIKTHPDISADIPKEVTEKVHTIETITHTEETNELKVQDVCHHTEDFLNAVFVRMEDQSVDLVEKLKDKNFNGPFVTEEFKKEMVSTVNEGGDNIHKDAICDRINEICEELHSLKHFPQNFTHSSTFPQRLIAEALPMQPDKVFKHIKKQILDDQHTLVKLLKGEKGLHELLNITVIDSFREETVGVIREFSDQIAEVILARVLIQSLNGLGDVHDLSSLLNN